MLKSAAEMAAAALAAKEKAAQLERVKRESEESRAAQKREASVRLDQAHGLFESQALAAARAGRLGVAVANVELSLDRLRLQGFVAERLARRPSFEKHLNALVNDKKEQLASLCERIVTAHPGLNSIEGDDLLHRNPLNSLLETLWRRGELRGRFDVELLFGTACIQSSMKPNELERAGPLFDQAMKLFADLKATETKLQRVLWESSTIPREALQATYVSWESADDGKGLAVAFSAQRLKWLSTRWSELASFIGTSISEQAQRGCSHLTAFAWRTDGPWTLSSAWPPDAWMEEDDPDAQDPLSATDSTWGGDVFCDPRLASDELMLAGYEVKIEPLAIGSTAAGSPAETYLAARAGEAYAIAIRW
jgi:hypothetical protein